MTYLFLLTVKLLIGKFRENFQPNHPLSIDLNQVEKKLGVFEMTQSHLSGLNELKMKPLTSGLY